MPNPDLSKPLWQLSCGDLISLLVKNGIIDSTPHPITLIDTVEKKYVYGISGIAKLFSCSIPTANRIKKSGKIDRAITQIGRKIIVDAELALELAGRKTGGRK